MTESTMTHAQRTLRVYLSHTWPLTLQGLFGLSLFHELGAPPDGRTTSSAPASDTNAASIFFSKLSGINQLWVADITYYSAEG